MTLQSCGEQGQSFVDQSAGTAKFRAEESSGDAQAALPTVDRGSVEKILAEMDQNQSKSSSASKSDGISRSDGNSKFDEDSFGRSDKSKGHSQSDNSCKSSDGLSSSERDDDDSDHDDDQISEHEMKACLALTGGTSDHVVRVNGSEHDVSLNSSSVIAVKVSGNHNTVNLDYSRHSDSVSAICVFVTGNQADFKATLSGHVGRLVYVARGNMTHGEISVAAGGSIDSEIIDLGGHDAKLTVQGDGHYSKDSAIIRGSSSGFQCAK